MNNTIQKKLNYFFVTTISFVSFFSVIYYGFIAVNPFDSFATYHTANNILNGSIPFKDYWESSGLLIDIFQAFFFKVFGVNWLSYTLHAGILNTIFSLSLYFVLLNFGLNKIYSFFYSVCLSVISNTQVGTAFLDHHSIIYTLIGLLFFLVAIKNDNKKLFFFIPILFSIAFLTKQVPAAYVAIIVSVGIVYQTLISGKYVNFIYALIGTIFSLTIFSILLFVFDINFQSFFKQYIIFPTDISSERFNADFLFPIEFNRYFLRYKLLHISYFGILAIIVFHFSKDKFFFKKNNFIIQLSLILTCYALIIHQMLTMNIKYIYMYIPILLGFTHIFIFENLKKKYLINLILIFCFLCTSYYFVKYVHYKKFIISSGNYSMEKVYKTKIIDDRFNFKWITHLDPSPVNEVKNLEKIINFFNNLTEEENYIIITDYQFIMTKIKKNRNIFVNKWYHEGISYPRETSQNFDYYRKFLIKKISDNNVIRIFFIYPSWSKFSNREYFKRVFSNCFFEEPPSLNKLVESINIKNCY